MALLRAVPGHHDPFSAVAGVDRLGSGLCRLDAIAQIADPVQRAPDAAWLQRLADMNVGGAREAVPEPDDLLAVDAAFTAATQALREPPC